MKKLLPVFIILAAVILLFLGYNYLDNKSDISLESAAVRTDVTTERAMYGDAEKALLDWEKGQKKNEIESAFLNVLENKTSRLAAENPYVSNMAENIDISGLKFPKEAEFNKDTKKLKSADAFVVAGKKYYAVYYGKAKDKSVKYFEEKTDTSSPVEIKLEGIPPAALYGFKTIKFKKDGIPLLVAMSFAGDDSWSSRNFYIMDKSGSFKKIYSFEGAWVEERYADLNGGGQLELILLRRLGYVPNGAGEIIMKLKNNNMNDYNAIFYEYEIVKWDEKNAGLVRAGSVIKVDFSHKE